MFDFLQSLIDYNRRRRPGRMPSACAAVQANALHRDHDRRALRPNRTAEAGSRGIDSLTVVQDARGRPLTKSFRRVGGRIVKGSYPNASEFRAFVVEVDGIASFAAVLDEVASGRPCGA